jgi:hypothetical protein
MTTTEHPLALHSPRRIAVPAVAAAGTRHAPEDRDAAGRCVPSLSIPTGPAAATWPAASRLGAGSRPAAVARPDAWTQRAIEAQYASAPWSRCATSLSAARPPVAAEAPPATAARANLLLPAVAVSGGAR